MTSMTHNFNEVAELDGVDSMLTISANYVKGTDEYIYNLLNHLIKDTNDFDKKDEFGEYDIKYLKDMVYKCHDEIQEVIRHYNDILDYLKQFEDYADKYENLLYDEDDDDEVEE